MTEAILKLVENNEMLHGILTAQFRVHKTAILYILGISIFCIIGTIVLYVVWFAGYNRTRKQKWFWSWLDDNIVEVIAKIAGWIMAFAIIIYSWFGIQFLGKAAIVLSNTWSVESGLGFLFWYDKTRFFYKYYDMGRYIVLIISILYFLYNILYSCIVGKQVTVYSGDQRRTIYYEQRSIKSGVGILCIYAILFSPFLDFAVNKISEKVHDVSIFNALKQPKESFNK